MARHRKRLLEVILIALPALAALGWSCYPAALVAWAIIDAPTFPLPQDEALGSSSDLDLRRLVQKHFLNNHVYIPIEDIISTASESGPESDQTSLIVQKTCGRGRLFVWLPFKFRLPITGEKVLEWCWKPQTKGS